MKVYHMSSTIHLGDTFVVDHEKLQELSQPFTMALERSEDCLYGMILNGKYLYAVLGKFRMWEWSDYAKWATEGVFEYIRKTEFPARCSRIRCNYYYDSLENCQRLFEVDWGNEDEETRSKQRLYEVDLTDDAPDRFDMRIYDEAYDAMCEVDIQRVIACARRYYSGECSDAPVMEIVSDQKAVAVKDITEFLTAKPTV